MDRWIEEFQKKNGRQPTSAELQAYAAEQGLVSGGVAPVQPPVEPGQPTQLEQPTTNVNTPTAYTEGPQQAPSAPQNSVMMQQGFNQSAQNAGPMNPPIFGSKAKRFFRSPLGRVTAVAASLLMVLAIMGLVTARSENRLRSEYNAAVRNKDTKALLSLFPKSQTRSRFAEIGAKNLIDSQISFDEFENDSSIFRIKVSSRSLLFFKRYSLDARTTKIDRGDAPAGSTLTIGNLKMNDKDFQTPFFPGKYIVKTERKTYFGPVTISTDFTAGKSQTESLHFYVAEVSVFLPAGPDSLKVSFGRREEHQKGVKLSNKEKKIGPVIRDREDPDGPEGYMYLNGEYGGVKIKDSNLKNMQGSDASFKMNEKQMLQIESDAVTYDKKNFDPYVEAWASDWFKYRNADFKSDLGKYDTDAKVTQGQQVDFDKNFNYAYKGFELDKEDPYLFFTGFDEHLYVVAKFNILYTKTPRNKKGAKSVDEHESEKIVFRLDEKGKMQEIGHYWLNMTL